MARELQPLDRRQVGENRRAEFLHRYAVLDGERRGLVGIRALRRHNVRAEQLAALGLGNKLNQAAGIARRQRAALCDGVPGCPIIEALAS